MRIVSTTCSNTEIVCALGRADWLVGVDRHSDHPAEVVANLPRVGPDLGVDVALVAALSPDLVLASLTVPGHENVVGSLEAAGLNVFAPEPISLEDTYRDILAIAERLEVLERGEDLVAAMREAIPDRSDDDGPRILVEWWPKPVIVPGRKSWVTDLIRLAGGVNPFGNEDAKSLPVGDSEVVGRDPEVVVMSWCGVDSERYRASEVYKRPWESTSAFRAQRVVPIPEAFLGRPGPRVVEGYRSLRRLVEGFAAEESPR